MNSPIRYFGGKGGMYGDIVKWFPDRNSYKTYIEPFAGAYNIGFKYDLTGKEEIYNDIEKNVYSLFKILSDETMFVEFKKKCDLVYYMEDYRKECRENLKRDDLSMVERAFYFFYSNRTSHNSIGGFSKSNSIRRGMSKSVSDMLATIDGLLDVHHRLSTVIVLNRDAMELMSCYDRKDVFMYCDPPYEWSTRTITRYDCDMQSDDHEKLIDILIAGKAKYLVSGYNCELYSRLDKNGFKRIDFNVNTIDGNGVQKTKTESLWMNYDKNKEGLFQLINEG